MTNSRRSFISKAAITVAMAPLASLSTFGQGYQSAIDKTPKPSAPAD
jgi:galactonate dehydratase